MSSTDPMRDDSSILSERMRRISLRPSRFLQLQNTKSSSLMRQITPPMMYNSAYGRLLRSLLKTADSFSPATTRTKSLSPCTPDVQSSTLESRERNVKRLPRNSSNVSKKSWVQKVLNMITRSW